MKASLALLVALFAFLVGPGTVSAAVIGTYTHDYGRFGDRVAPEAFGRLWNSSVWVENSVSGVTDFRDSIDLSALPTGATVDSIALELDFDRAGPNPNISENWFVEISGAGAGFGLSTFALLSDVAAPQTVLLLPGTNAFDAALSDLSLDFTFTEPGIGRRDTFRLFRATVTVSGSVVAAVPLPAPGILLLVALGGLAFLRRKPAPDAPPRQT